MKRSLYIFLPAGFYCLSSFAQKPNLIFTDKMALEESQNFYVKSSIIESSNYSTCDLTYQCMEWNINLHVRYIKASKGLFEQKVVKQL